MKVLVTGGGGFLGAWIIKRLLKSGHQARVFDIKTDQKLVRQLVSQSEFDTIEWRTGDIRNAADVEAALEGCDRVAHLAGVLTPVCQANPVLGAEINLIGTLNVFNAALKWKLPSVVYASTAGVYGPDDAQFPLPTTHYGAFKLATEGSARAYWSNHQLPSVGFRPFVVYGPGREIGLSAGPSLACKAAALGEAYVIPYTGASGLVYVDDVAAAFEHALLSNDLEGTAVHDLIGELASTDDIIAAIRKVVPNATLSASGPGLPIAVGQTEDSVNRWYPQRPRTSLEQGVRSTLSYYQSSQ